MNYFRALLWKESRENLPRLLGLLVAYAFLTTLIAASRDLDTVQFGVLVLTLFAPALVAFGILSNERWRHTQMFLHALPVRPRTFIAAKWFWGLLTALLPPLLVVAGASLLWHFGPEDRYALRAGPWACQIASTAALVYTWTLFAGAAARDQRRCLAGIAMLLLANFAILLAGGFGGGPLPYVVLPWFAAFGADDFGRAIAPGSIALIQVCACLVLTPLAILLWSRRHAGLPARRASLDLPRATAARIRPHSWRTPIVTKAWREVRVPVVLLAAVITLPLPIAVLLKIGRPLLMDPDLVVVAATEFGYLGALFAAVGLGARLGATQSASPDAFWFSRPIPAARYFWHHALTDLLALAVLLASPILVARLVARFLPAEVEGAGLSFGIELPSMLAGVLLLTIPLIYFVSMLLGALTRSRVLAAAGAVAFSIGWAVMLPLLFEGSEMPYDLHTATAGFFGTLFLVVVAATLARLFFEHTPFSRHRTGEAT
ncbi:MAG TPA: hypothetical protein VH253_13885 [Phycisphaerae bacterium]|nr:hypothetical protein [Phycisphaerae bacterium]